MSKKGDIWISAILYMALGIVLLTIVLAAGLPAIQKMKDSYTVRQTKNLMIELDGTIRDVFHEGPGSKRTVSLKIGRGDFVIDEANDVIEWSIESSSIISEIGVVVDEGNLHILTDTTGVKGKYSVNLLLNYSGLVNITYDGSSRVSGDTKLSILNKGSGGSLTEIAIVQL